MKETLEARCRGQAEAVLPAFARLLGEAGARPDTFLRGIVLILWQLSAAGEEAGEWQGRLSQDKEGFLIASRLAVPAGMVPPQSDPVFDACFPNAISASSGERWWELQIRDTHPLPAPDQGKGWAEGDGWRQVAGSLGALLNQFNRLQDEVRSLTEELMLTSQGVVALVEEMQIWVEKGEGMAPSGLLEDRVRANRDLVHRLQEKEKALQQADRLATIGRLVAGVAHEINNPLTFIKVNAELLSRYLERGKLFCDAPAVDPIATAAADPAGKPAAVSAAATGPASSTTGKAALEAEAKRANQAIFRGVERIANIVSGLKYFSRQERGEKCAVQLRKCLEDAWLLVSSDSELSRHVQFAHQVPGDLYVRGNAQQLEQVLINLMHNALKAIQRSERAPGRLLVESYVASDQSGQAIIRVRDNGCGIDPAELPNVFEPFYTNDGKGTGLGLSIVQGIVTEHGGTITVASEPGAGAVFTIRLPAMPPEEV
ncbi:hypothetical protein GTO91_11315 [Heliobacterium undosum]|uniref:histidine kinase n=1 Tax=Heliomicrobium undosum TaxID=121734 RepID=A0A845L502_9FIRM|nr:ATP-binding protein [Heliomicrobium undosum]MZP30299.1 hypothetical protein [Heliomicrobium undosum]